MRFAPPIARSPARQHSHGDIGGPDWSTREIDFRQFPLRVGIIFGAYARTRASTGFTGMRGDFWFPAFAGMTAVGQCYRRLGYRLLVLFATLSLAEGAQR